MERSDLPESYARQIPIDQRRGQRRRVAKSPQLRLYNPSRIIAPVEAKVVQSFRFWNPFTGDSVIKAAYGSFARNMAVDNFMLDPWKRERLYHREAEPRDLFDTGIWVPNEFPFGDYGYSGRNSDLNYREQGDWGNWFLDAMWNELSPFRWNPVPLWFREYRDNRERDTLPVDIRNYRIATGRSRDSLVGDQLYNSPLIGSGNQGSSLWSAYSGLRRSDDNERYELKFRLQGVKEEDIKISIRDGLLTVKAKSGTVKHGDEHEYTVRHAHNFHHSVSLPRDAVETKARASLSGDTLTVSIPIRQNETTQYKA